MNRIRHLLKRIIKTARRKVNVDLALLDDSESKASFVDFFRDDLGDEGLRLLKLIQSEQWSMTSRLNLMTTALACRHVISENIPGDFIECGVWRGGHAILAAGIFSLLNSPRRVFLFDTFEGMPEPSPMDVRTTDGKPADKFYKAAKKQNIGWCFASLDEVRANFRKAGVPMDNVVFVKGQVENTLRDDRLASKLGNDVSILRIDTDWYDSTKVELEVLWPKLSNEGILVIDDYGYWSGARKAVDEFFHTKKPFMTPIGEASRVVVKRD